MNLSEKYDIAFLWVDTNDILTHNSMMRSAIKIVFNQTITENQDEFRECYIDIINTISPIANKIFIVLPLRYRNPYRVPICPLSQSLIIPLLHHSKTPVLLIRLTASFNKDWMTAVYQQP